MSIFKLVPAFKNYLWGGQKLVEKYGKKTEVTPVAESWELSLHPDGPSLTEDGALLSSLPEEAFGKNVSSFGIFPVLIKFIDANGSLSIQVHPSDEYALKNENSLGKTETWYIVEAEEGAGIYLGFDRKTDKEEFKKAVAECRFTELLNFYNVRAGESYFIPSGTVHAICKGCLILEIQQNSNITYRIYDYDRVDANGNKRMLHVDKAAEVANTEKFVLERLPKNVVGLSKYFTAVKYVFKKKTFFADENSFECVTCVKGGGSIDGRPFSVGDSFFVPAGYGKYVVEGDGEVVITSVRRYHIDIERKDLKLTARLSDDRGRVYVKSTKTLGAITVPTIAEYSEKLVSAVLKRAKMSYSDLERAPEIVAY